MSQLVISNIKEENSLTDLNLFHQKHIQGGADLTIGGTFGEDSIRGNYWEIKGQITIKL